MDVRRQLLTRTASLVLLVTALALPALALDPVNTGRFSDVAIKGYDPVAYFTDSAAVEGEKSFTHTWNGAEWRFASAEHRDLFAADPEKYAPQYGGYCAYAVSKGSTANIDPEAWSIWEDKLYLNYSKKIGDKWSTDVPGHVARADENWPGLLAD
ncbi:MAG: YHS domain protein [Actinomycetia bacterium]|nr:YHS domain protein [Actinomycetes bacterium]